MNRLVAVATVFMLVVVAALSGCVTPCCYCYCGDVPTNQLVEQAEVSRPEVPLPSVSSMNNVVVARY